MDGAVQVLSNDSSETDEDLFVRITELCTATSPEDSNACEASDLHVLLLGHGFVLLFCCAMFGNCLNLVIYNSAHIRHHLAIRMLCTRLLMNTLTLLCMLPPALRLLQVWDHNSYVEVLYWRSWPYVIFFGNLFGFCAMWLTVLMVGECYMHIFEPLRSKSICTRPNLRRCYFVIGSAGVLLNIIYPINRTPMKNLLCDKVVVTIVSRYNNELVSVWETVHPVASALVALLIPLCLLVAMTLAIFCRIQCGEARHKTHFSAEKSTVTRLTMITTGLQLADFPAVFVFVYAALRGPNGITSVCTLYSVSLFLGLANMSISFYVYVLFSPRFRTLSFVRFCAIVSYIVPCMERRPKRDSLLHDGNHSTAIATTKRGLTALTVCETDRLTSTSFNHPDEFL